jgi:hypothetical protein
MASSREWISRSGPGSRRGTTLTFVLSKPTIVEFVLVRVAPDCRPVGRFRVKGHAGQNRVRFRGRIKGRALSPGTYVIRARTLPARRALTKTKLVIFKRRPLAGELAAAQASNTCGSSDGGTSYASALGGGPGPPLGSGDAGKLQVKPSTEESEPIRVGRSRGKTPAAVLGVRFTRAADAVKEVPALLYLLLGIAIGLLAAAAMPLRFVPSARMAAVLAYRRTFVAMAGAITLASVAVVYALA